MMNYELDHFAPILEMVGDMETLHLQWGLRELYNGAQHVNRFLFYRSSLQYALPDSSKAWKLHSLVFKSVEVYSSSVLH